ncbi:MULTISPECIES: NAD-dependent epimerase/dehydratase family protein [Streptomyces]|uniref:NAD-dependent epimerase/dehydratase family protein n=1 Tax=Streptomyces TaxID=1883 RepID=UPI001319D582|nr:MULTISPECIES: NAD(P)-dependent oxidoreductase [Streptomyces]QKV71658.1 NAD(P)-dependent oxidoreductase [Streptomyces harbinensis]
MSSDRREVAGLSVAILGGTGFLGRHLGVAFAARGARVHLVSRTGPPPGGPDPVPGAATLRLDLLAQPPRRIAAALASAGVEVVVNAAGRVWQAGEEEMAAGNAELVERVVTAVSTLPGPPVRLVQLGSVHEYGAGGAHGATDEEHEPAPVTPYGRTKLLGTRAVLRGVRERNVDAVVLRLAIVIGAGMPSGSLFGRVADHLGEAARASARGEPIPPLQLPPLRVARDLVDAADVADAVLAAATAPSDLVGGRVLNVGGGEAVPMRDLVDRMITLSGLDLPVIEAAEPPAARTDVARQCLDIARAGHLLGWRPTRTVDDSLRDLLTSVLPRGLPPHATPLGMTAGAPAEKGERP